MRLDSGSAKLLDDVAPAGGGFHGDGDLLTTEPFGELIEPGPQALAGSRADLAAMQLAALHLYVVEGDLLSMYVETTYNVHVGPPQAPLFTRHGYGLTASASELGRSLFTKVLLALAFSCHLFMEYCGVRASHRATGSLTGSTSTTTTSPTMWWNND